MLFGTLLVVGGIWTAVFRDPYDIGRNNLIVIGVLYAMLGAFLGAVGWFLWLLGRRR